MTNENEDRIKRLEDQLSGIRAAMRERMGKHLASVGGDSQYVSSNNHAGSWTPTGLDTPVSSNNIHVTTNHNPRDGTVRFYLGTDVPNPKHATAKPHTESPTTRVHLAHGIIYPAGNIDILPKPAWTHTADGTIDEKAIKFILTDHLNSPIKHPTTGKVITVADHHGLQNSLIEEWTQKYKKSIDCSNPKGFSQRAHCQGRKKKLHEDLRRWFKEKWTAQDGSECGDYKGRGRVKCRPSKRVSDKSPETWGEMSPKEKKKAVRLKQKAHREGKQFSSHKSGKTWDGKKNKYKPGKKKLKENMNKLINSIVEGFIKGKTCGCGLNEEKKPYKGFKKGKNHPEGGLSRAEARRQGIHAGIETKDEAKRKGGFGKLSKKTQARRKSFCARMCGMKKRRTSSKTARDPKSKINAALRVWGCRCGTNESFNANSNLIINEGMGRYILKKVGQDEELDKSGNAVKSHLYHIILNQKKVGFIDANLSSKRMKGRLNGKKLPEMDFKNPQARLHGFLKSDRGSEFIKESLELTEGKNKPTNKKLWSRAKALARSKFKVYPSAYANAWASKWYKKRGGGWSSMQSESVMKTVVEEIVNKKHKGTMSKKELSSRDRLAANVKGIRAIKGNDSDKNAKYRYATYVILKKRGEKSSESSGKKKSKSSKKK